MAVNPRYMTFIVESHTVNIQYTTRHICDSIQQVVDFRRESVVLQVSNSRSKNSKAKFVVIFSSIIAQFKGRGVEICWELASKESCE